MNYTIPYKTYNESLKKNKLLGLKCNECSTITCPPKMTCQECTGTDLEQLELKGTGKIVSFTTSYVAPQGREAEAPYTIVLVELDEGPWIMGNLIDIDPREVDIQIMGKKVYMGHKVFPGDIYSAGEGVRPLFSFAE
jgi:uncharacterized OB-fold protein